MLYTAEAGEYCITGKQCSFAFVYQKSGLLRSVTKCTQQRKKKSGTPLSCEYALWKKNVFVLQSCHAFRTKASTKSLLHRSRVQCHCCKTPLLVRVLRSLEVKRDIVELLQCKNRLMKRNADLQKALDVCEDSNTHLQMENSTLRSQIKWWLVYT